MFTAPIFTITKHENNQNVHQKRNKEDTVHKYNRTLLSHKKDEMPFAATWTTLETVMLSEVRERQILSDAAYMWNL